MRPHLFFALVLAACSPAPQLPAPTDASDDLRVDAPLDIAPDLPLDVAPDVPLDVAPDLPLDIAPDVPTDAPFDRPTDALSDRPDAASDALSDRPTDVLSDRPDAAVDVPLDLSDAASDAPSDRPDVPPAWGLDTRPRNSTCVAFPRPTAGTSVTFTPVYTSLPAGAALVGQYQAPGDRSYWYRISQVGTVGRFANTPTVSAQTPVLDLSSRVLYSGELGLLGMAFHPSFGTNGQVFLSYTARPRAGISEAAVSRLSRFRTTDGGATISASTEEILLEVSQPYTNHNGGWIEFGPDGYLYYSLGDGGSGGDPMGNGQNTNTLLGKILRIDVNRATAPLRYAIPADNPFASGTGGRPEIFAWGFRNAWRCSFDRASGDLWAGDVGQNTLEEIDLVRRGGNYGWKVMEGTRCYEASTCAQSGLIPPVVEYGRSLGVSVTGGYVYRGTRIPWLVGSYVFGDYISGRVWRVAYGPDGRASMQELGNAGVNISSFAQDTDGEIYVLSYSNARVLRIDPGPESPMDTVPATIRATGCVDAVRPLDPAPGLIPYTLNAPFWSDGADKERFMALPDGARITVQPDGDWDLPVGSVLVKNFTHMGRRIETRLFVRHSDGEWAGYSYRWNDAQTDAVALPGSDARDLPGGTRWLYPTRAQCMECHTAAAGRSLGLETAQLNTTLRYPSTGRTANQLVTLEHIGLFAAPLGAPPSALPALAAPTGTAPIDVRARAYLHANCSMCHRPGGPGRGAMDLRVTATSAAMRVCDVVPSAGDLGVTSARIVAPGDPARSVLSVRARATNVWRMPPISSNVVDTAGVTLLDEWIRGVRACP